MAKKFFWQTNDGRYAGYRYRGVFHTGLSAKELATRLQIAPGEYEVQIDSKSARTAAEIAD